MEPHKAVTAKQTIVDQLLTGWRPTPDEIAGMEDDYVQALIDLVKVPDTMPAAFTTDDPYTCPKCGAYRQGFRHDMTKGTMHCKTCGALVSEYRDPEPALDSMFEIIDNMPLNLPATDIKLIEGKPLNPEESLDA